jgi:hypothetical protein
MLGRVQLAALLSLAVLLCAGTPRSDDLIIPGLRVGPITRASTEQTLPRSLGTAATHAEIGIGEGFTQPGLIIYKNDPARRLGVTFNDDTPPHPAIVFICYEEFRTPCRWRPRSGVHWGLSLKDLERLNGAPFQITGTGTDVSGNVVSWNGGRLERELASAGRLMVTLDVNSSRDATITATEYEAIRGDKIFSSSHPVFQRLNPRVIGMDLKFP